VTGPDVVLFESRCGDLSMTGVDLQVEN